jgi:2-keto-4-pentenoate hydratase/2-oxohepta-3-ene-1,7-dioic acid hydratase in catechol pathway
MRLVTFGDDFQPGLLVGQEVIGLGPVLQDFSGSAPEERMLDLIANFGDLRAHVERLASSGQGVPVSAVRLRAPLPRPGKLLAAVGNFNENGQRETQPIDWFFKSPESICGPGDTVILPPHKARIFHHEAELGVVIGRRCKDVPAASAMECVFGYTSFIDVSARDVGRPRISTFFGKSFDTFGPMGPCLVTADEIPDPYTMSVRLTVDGQPRQRYPLSDMANRLDALIANASAIMTLLPGDFLACGTNHQGLGALQDGDQVHVEITGIGSFDVTVRDPLRRRWPRSIDEEMAARVRTTTAAQPQEGARA